MSDTEEIFDKSAGSANPQQTQQNAELLSELYGDSGQAGQQQGQSQDSVPDRSESQQQAPKSDDEGSLNLEDMQAQFEKALDERVSKNQEQFNKLFETIEGLKSQSGKTEQKEQEIPKEPTKTEFEEDPEAWFEKKMKVREYQENQKKELEKKKAYEDQYWDSQEKIKDEEWNKVVDKFPQLKSKTSDLFKKANEIFQKKVEQNPFLKNNPLFDSLCAQEAAEQLGLEPLRRNRLSQEDTSIMHPSSSSGNASKGLSPQEFDALTSNQKEEYMKKEYFGRF